MKNKFGWYLNASPQMAEKAWESAILTLDTNVLLDLYRYHSSTRDSILDAIEAFAPRVWISYQAASEFFANRKTVIASSEKTFREAQSAVDELVKSLEGNISKLRSNRLLPRQTLDELSSALTEASVRARVQITEASKNHPNYLQDDPILDRLLSVFDGKIGDAFQEAERTKLLEQGELRFKSKTPPGYKDDGKDGDRKYGDFLLWSQIIEYAKVAKAPVILVTSERKEDWWEMESGKTLGPRMELIQEFDVATGQQVFIYQTDNFIKIAAERGGTNFDPAAVEEIREISASRSRQYKPNPPAVDVEQLSHITECDEHHGTLEIELLREVFNMTGSGHLEPEMNGIPRVVARVTSAPDGCPPFTISAGTGTIFDFNVHIRASKSGLPLPVGHYSIEYSAVCESDDDTSEIQSVVYD